MGPSSIAWRSRRSVTGGQRGVQRSLGKVRASSERPLGRDTTVIAGDHSRHLSETVKQRATGKRLVAPEPGRSPSFIRDYHDSVREGSRGVSMRAWPRSPIPDPPAPKNEI